MGTFENRSPLNFIPSILSFSHAKISTQKQELEMIGQRISALNSFFSLILTFRWGRGEGERDDRKYERHHRHFSLKLSWYVLLMPDLLLHSAPEFLPSAKPLHESSASMPVTHSHYGMSVQSNPFVPLSHSSTSFMTFSE